MSEVLCKTCVCAVMCGDRQFCLCEDLFTYTERTACPDYRSGEPISDEEFESGKIEG